MASLIHDFPDNRDAYRKPDPGEPKPKAVLFEVLERLLNDRARFPLAPGLTGPAGYALVQADHRLVRPGYRRQRSGP